MQPQEFYVDLVAKRLLDVCASQKRSRVLFVTGAGMSAESGLPTYRGVSGLYNQGVTEDGLAIEEAISGPILQRRPAVAWKYIAQIEESCRGKEPNAGHLAIKKLEKLREKDRRSESFRFGMVLETIEAGDRQVLAVVDADREASAARFAAPGVEQGGAGITIRPSAWS